MRHWSSDIVIITAKWTTYMFALHDKNEASLSFFLMPPNLPTRNKYHEQFWREQITLIASCPFWKHKTPNAIQHWNRISITFSYFHKKAMYLLMISRPVGEKTCHMKCTFKTGSPRSLTTLISYALFHFNDITSTLGTTNMCLIQDK